MKKHHGPHPGIVAIVYSLLLALTVISYNIPGATRINALFQFGAAIPVGIFTAAVTSRLHFLGVNVTGVSIALYGGIAASVLLILSGLSTWASTQPDIANDTPVVHALQHLGFGCGGYAFIVMLGLMMAGISVPSLFGHYNPRWLVWLGLVLAGFAELSTLGLIVPQLVWLLPVVRIPSVIWMIGTGFTLRKTREGGGVSAAA
ncbi:hypothetical protein [Puia dinghuensis]|uniref:DUF4386 domain-containing protein n=1 Tax=Puia dinghuensis TaxID=1792502 RepID=A0A8J2XUX1_9BACT|nr:hypothetical protein [Puia dinghuensis]GGB12778.1 hypothetical protein GCM10011511_40530 [Puia dinghuensis]